MNCFKTFYCILLMSIAACDSQVPESKTPVPPPPSPPKVLDNSPIVCRHAGCQITAVHSTYAQFPNNDTALAVYLTKHVKYPPMSREGGIEGTVYIRFVVNKNGALQNIEVVRGMSGGCSEEAVRVVQGMPKWIPATKNGENVCSRFTLPVKFKMD